MRATKTNTSEKTTSAHKSPKASRKSRKAFKVTSAGFAALIAAAVFIVPTTTLAPGVEAYADSRVSSYAVGDIDKFADAISGNCVESTTVPRTQAVTAPVATVQPTTAPAAKSAKTDSKSASAQASAASAKKTSASSATQMTASSSSVIKVPQSAKASSTVVSDIDKDDSYSYSYESSSSGSGKSQSSESHTSYSESSYSEESYYEEDDYDDDYDDGGYDSGSSYSGSGSALIDVANPDYSYSATHLSLSSYDRAKLERLVMGEAGTMGFNGCAVVAQAIRDSMVRSNTTSIDRIISEYQYFGSTNIQPNEDVKAAVSYIFDQDGIAVQHRVMCFYIGYSAWHETQIYLCTIDGVRFFDLTVA